MEHTEYPFYRGHMHGIPTEAATVIHDCSPECAATHVTVSMEIIPDNPGGHSEP